VGNHGAYPQNNLILLKYFLVSIIFLEKGGCQDINTSNVIHIYPTNLLLGGDMKTKCFKLIMMLMTTFVVLFNVSLAQQPYDQVIGPPDVPGEMILNETYTIRIYLQNGSSTATENGGWLDVSFPQSDRVLVSQGSESTGGNGWDSYDSYFESDQIYHRTLGWISVQYPLFSASAQSWGDHQIRWIEINVTPIELGSFYIYYRRTIDGNIAPGSSSFTDQQGWPVRRYLVTVVDESCDPPDVPTGLHASTSTPCPDEYYQISWNSVSGATEYHIYQDATDNRVWSGTNLSVSFKNTSGTHYYWVRAQNDCEDDDYSDYSINCNNGP